MLVIDTVGSHTALAHAHNWQGHPLDTSSLGTLFSNWDGKWYLTTAATWYYHHVDRLPGAYTTLGFMPLYPMVMWLVAHVLPIGNLGAGLAVSMISGGIATVLISQLAAGMVGRGGRPPGDQVLVLLSGNDRLLDGLQRGPDAELDRRLDAAAPPKTLAMGGRARGLFDRYRADLPGRRADVRGGCAARAAQPRLARPRGAQVADRADPLTAGRDRLRHLPVGLDRLAVFRLHRTAHRMVGVDDAARDPAPGAGRDPPDVRLRRRVARPGRDRPQRHTGAARNRIHGVRFQAALGPPLSRTRDRLGVDGVRLVAGADLSQDAAESRGC